MMRAAGALLVAIVTMSGCTPFVGACTQELGVRLTPQDTTLAAGQAFTPAIALTSCGGREQLEDTFAFTTSNAMVASVDRTTGRITALAAGQADVLITGGRYGPVGQVRVTVSP